MLSIHKIHFRINHGRLGGQNGKRKERRGKKPSEREKERMRVLD